MSDVVETIINDKPFGAVESSANAQEQEVNDLSEFLKLERNKYLQYKIIYDTIEEYVNENSETDKSLKSKIKDILISGDVAQTVTLDDNILDECNGSIFGLANADSPQLNYKERNQLQEILKLKLDQKCKEADNGFLQSTNMEMEILMLETENTMSIQLSKEDKALLDYKNKLLCEQEKYVKNLLNLLDLLKEISELRLKKLPQVIEHKIRECQIEEKTNHLKCLLTQEKLRVDVFTETRCSLKAYKELIHDITEQQQDCRKEIQNLTELKERYKQVSCKQYDDILKSYLQYKSSIEKKKLLYNCLKS